MKGLSKHIKELEKNGHYFFLSNDMQCKSKLTEDNYRVSLHRLIKKNKIRRIRGNFFIILPPVYQSLGSLPADTFIDNFMSHLNQPYYIGILSAAALLGSAHQQPMTFQVITNKIMRPIINGNVKICFYYKKDLNPTSYQRIPSETGYYNTASLEATLCDLLIYQKAAGFLNNITNHFIELSPKININKLINYIKRNNIPVSVIQRMGYLLNKLELEVDLETELFYNAFQDKFKKSYLLLPYNNKTPFETCNKWKILINHKLEPDI